MLRSSFFRRIIGTTILLMGFYQDGECSTSEEELVDYLTENYSPYVRPVLQDNQTLFVYYHIKLSRLLKLHWVDEFLRWDPLEHNNLTTVHIPSSRLWIPDTVLYQTADVNREPGTGVLMTNAVVNYTGGVYWAAPAIFTSSCKLDITYFPFDKQQCVLTFGPWAYTGNLVQMKTVSTTGDTSMMTPNGQWELLSMPVVENLKYYGCCPDPFSDITFTINLQRKALFYLFNLLGPAVFLSFVSLLGFYLPADSGEKVGLNITVMLSLVFYLLLGAQLLPPTSDTFAMLAQYFSVVIVMMSFETAISVFLLNLHHHDPDVDPPKWARWLILEKIGPVILSRFNEGGDSGQCQDTDFIKPTGSSQDDTDFSIISDLNSAALGNSLLNKLQLENEPCEKKNGITDGGHLFHDNVDANVEAEVGKNVLRIGNYIEKIVRRAKHTDLISQTQQDWMELGIVIDRLLLLIFLLIFIIIFVVFLLRMFYNT
ncbi:neuronal acetylcholine receptor subunit alpha-10-like isoform X2 [Ptychodera flava]|uniref:neuronal acetylcholine receptor subunit alpha-10-like isoform X2 n=1 Tax=Ptychodera flava TaxID=63121 RepID=UPI003969DA82